jgi:lauroyl/myristoyl acyltransferase
VKITFCPGCWSASCGCCTGCLACPARLWAGLGRLLYVLGRERRKVALTNLRLCFPEKTEAEREGIARRHFVAFAKAVLDRTLGWWASRSGWSASSASRVSSI